MKRKSSLLLKWGTIKGWSGMEGACLELLNQYFADGRPLSCMADHPDEARKKILCELIDKFKGTIQNDWTGKKMSKKQAKKYVMEYGQCS